MNRVNQGRLGTRDQDHRLLSVLFVITVVLVALVLAAVLLAYDYEPPIIPPPTPSGPAAFGELTVNAADVSGATIDVKDAVEPQVTVMLTTDDSVCGEMTVSTQPLYYRWAPYPLDSP